MSTYDYFFRQIYEVVNDNKTRAPYLSHKVANGMKFYEDFLSFAALGNSGDTILIFNN